MTTQSLTQQYAAELAKGVVPGILKAIHAAKRDTRLIVAAVLAITYYHQAHWLSTIAGIGVLGFAIPLVVDLAMLRMLGIIQTVGMRGPAKTGALVLTVFLAAMSGAVNVAAPGAVAARVIFGALVAMAAGVKVVTALVGPDLASMEQQESAAASAVAAPAREVRRCAPDCSCKRHARNRPAVEPVVQPEPVHVIAPPRPRTRRPATRRIGALGPGWMSPDVRLAVANAR